MKIAQHPQGVPSWVELMTTDEAGALAFYSALFGWTDDAIPLPGDMGAYHMQQLGGDNVAAIGLQNADERAQGVPPHWSVYLAADRLEAVTDRVAGAGGTVVLPPMDVMDAGRMAIIADPTGGIVGLWEAKQHTGFQRIREPGTFTWAELMTDDPDRAAAFLSTVLDAPTEAMPMGPNEPPYTLLGPPQGQGAGIMRKTPEMGPMPNVWGIYFEVADTDATVAQARSLGATVVAEPMDIMPGRFAMIRDPQGAIFGIIKSAPMPG